MFECSLANDFRYNFFVFVCQYVTAMNALSLTIHSSTDGISDFDEMVSNSDSPRHYHQTTVSDSPAVGGNVCSKIGMFDLVLRVSVIVSAWQCCLPAVYQ